MRRAVGVRSNRKKQKGNTAACGCETGPARPRHTPHPLSSVRTQEGDFLFSPYGHTMHMCGTSTACRTPLHHPITTSASDNAKKRYPPLHRPRHCARSGLCAPHPPGRPSTAAAAPRRAATQRARAPRARRSARAPHQPPAACARAPASRPTPRATTPPPHRTHAPPAAPQLPSQLPPLLRPSCRTCRRRTHTQSVWAGGAAVRGGAGGRFESCAHSPCAAEPLGLRWRGRRW